ncbi:NUDIX hydrolase [Niveibacterium sp.]|uniref:NUDIX hydrolase n=1 Tax=Niveibacterium sp. TaxID=2017444 RepID=UPI0035B33556
MTTPDPHTLPIRRAARLIVLDVSDRVLLFHFEHAEGPLAGSSFWATPGGALAPGEPWRHAAARELQEETGLGGLAIGPELGERSFAMQLPDGDWVHAEERFYLVRTTQTEISRAGWSEAERRIMREHRWWSQDEIAAAQRERFPRPLPDLLAKAAVISALR